MTTAVSLPTPIKQIPTVRARYCTLLVRTYYNAVISVGDGTGDACEGDEDGDGTRDDVDPCPLNGKITTTDFRKFQIVNLLSAAQKLNWIILNQVSVCYCPLSIVSQTLYN